MNEDLTRAPHEIERESFRIINEELLERRAGAPLDALEAPVIERVIHATADFDFADAMTFTPGALQAGLTALHSGATVLTDANMALAGVSKPALAKLGCKGTCYMADPGVAAAAREQGTTRARASMDRACEIEGPLVIAIGNAPTALMRVCELVREGRMRPDLVIGVPVGFVHVVESKEELLASGIPAIVARGRKGGSTVATAIVNALLYLFTRGQVIQAADGTWQAAR